MNKQTIGSLQCYVVDGGSSPKIPVIILHGYGASASDLAPLAEPWMDQLGDLASAFRFIFPDALTTLEAIGMPDARAWWPINMAGMMEAVQAGSFEELHRHEPDGIASARDAVDQCINEAIGQCLPEQMSGDPPIYVIGGFSQGAMLATDVALRAQIHPPAALLMMSGTLICLDAWSEAFPRLRQTRIIQSHGTVDPILPFSSAETLKDLMVAAGLNHQFCPFQGPHTVGGEMVQVCGEVLASLAGSNPSSQNNNDD